MPIWLRRREAVATGCVTPALAAISRVAAPSNARSENKSAAASPPNHMSKVLTES